MYRDCPPTIAVSAKHLVSTLRILLFQIQPDDGGIPTIRLDNVGSLLHMEGRLLPVDAVPGGGIARGAHVAAHVPHFEQMILRIIPYAIAEDHSRGVLPFILPGPVWFENWIVRVIPGCMVGSLKRCRVDEKVIDKELSSHVYWDDIRGICQVRRSHGLQRERFYLRRPGRWQTNTIVKSLVRRSIRNSHQGG
jgi:hypothetical protein